MRKLKDKTENKGVGKISRLFAIDRNIPLEMIPLVFPLDNALPEDVEKAKNLFAQYRKVIKSQNSHLFKNFNQERKWSLERA